MGFSLKRLGKQFRAVKKVVSPVTNAIRKVVAEPLKKIVGSVPIVGPAALAVADLGKNVRSMLRPVKKSINDFLTPAESARQASAQPGGMNSQIWNAMQRAQASPQAPITPQVVGRVPRAGFGVPWTAQRVSAHAGNRQWWTQDWPQASAPGPSLQQPGQAANFLMRRRMLSQQQAQQPNQKSGQRFFSSGKFFR